MPRRVKPVAFASNPHQFRLGFADKQQSNATLNPRIRKILASHLHRYCATRCNSSGELRAMAMRYLSGFSHDEGGNTAMVFALSLVPVIFAAGSALDYSRAGDLRTKLQVATDGTLLSLCQAKTRCRRTSCRTWR